MPPASTSPDLNIRQMHVAQIRLWVLALLLQCLGALGFAMAFLRGLTLVALPFLARGDASALRGQPALPRTLPVTGTVRAWMWLAMLHNFFREPQISQGGTEMYRNLFIVDTIVSRKLSFISENP